MVTPGPRVPWSCTPRDLSRRGGERQCRGRRGVRSAHRECAGDWGSRLTDGARSCRPVRGSERVRCGCEGSRLGSDVRPCCGGRFRLHERRGSCRWGVRVVGWRGERCRAWARACRRDSTRSLALAAFGLCRDGEAERRGGGRLGRAALRGELLGRAALRGELLGRAALRGELLGRAALRGELLRLALGGWLRLEAARLADFRPLLWLGPGVAANTTGMPAALVIRVWPAADAGCVAAPAQKITAAAVTATDHVVSSRDAVICVRLPCLSGFSSCSGLLRADVLLLTRDTVPGGGFPDSLPDSLFWNHSSHKP